MILSNSESPDLKKSKSNCKKISAEKKVLIEELRKITEEEEVKR